MAAIKSISIPEPCHQSWQAMEERESGRHCLHCAKTVIDFSKMTDDEILAYLAGAKNVCGRFGERQLTQINHQLKSENATESLPWKKWLVAAGLLGATFSTRLSAQPVIKPTITRSPEDSVTTKSSILGGIATTGIYVLPNVHGRVISAINGRPLVGALVRIKGKRQSVVTDSVGYFYIPTNKKSVELTIECKDHDLKKISIVPGFNEAITITMQPKVVGVMGYMVVRRPFYIRWYDHLIKQPLRRLFN